MYSSKNPREVNVLVAKKPVASYTATLVNMELEDRIAISEHKQRAQQHVLKVFKMQRNLKITGYKDQIRNLRKENRRKRKQLGKTLQKAKLLPQAVVKTKEQELLNQKNLNQLRYERSKVEKKLKERKTYYAYLLDMVGPKREEEVRHKAAEQLCCDMENRLSDLEMRNNMAHTITLYYKEIRNKYDRDHPRWPTRVRSLKNSLGELTADLQFLKRAARLAIGEKSFAVKKYQKMYYHHVKDREERRKQQADLIDHIRSLKDEFVPFPDVRPSEELFQAQSPRTTFQHCLHALRLQEAFDIMQQNIPEGGNVESVIERLGTQVRDRKKMTANVDELHEEQTKLMAEVERLEQHRSLLQYGGNDLLCKHNEYVCKLEKAIEEEEKRLEGAKKKLQESAALVTQIRAGFCSVLDTIRGKDRMKREVHPSDILDLFAKVEKKLLNLREQARDVKPEDIKEVQRPGFNHFMENELDRQVESDPVCRILAKNQSIIITREHEDLDDDIDNYIDMEEFRAALKNKSIKLYLSRCPRAKALKGVPSDMTPQYRPEREDAF